MVRPGVKIYLKWSNLKKGDWKAEIKKSGFTMVSGPDLKLPSEESRLFGLFRYSQKKGDYENLAMPFIDWGRYYCLLTESVMDGNLIPGSLQRQGRQSIISWACRPR